MTGIERNGGLVTLGMPEQPQVGIITGSDSDFAVAMHIGMTLGANYSIWYEEDIASAHRTPSYMVEYANEAEERGLEVIVAVAGGSAHLAGMVAVETALPVLAVAVGSSQTSETASMYSSIIMPPGSPLFFMGIGKTGAINAAHGAAKIIGARDPIVRQEYKDRVAADAIGVRARGTLTRLLGMAAYTELDPGIRQVALAKIADNIKLGNISLAEQHAAVTQIIT